MSDMVERAAKALEKFARVADALDKWERVFLRANTDVPISDTWAVFLIDGDNPSIRPGTDKPWGASGMSLTRHDFIEARAALDALRDQSAQGERRD